MSVSLRNTSRNQPPKAVRKLQALIPDALSADDELGESTDLVAAISSTRVIGSALVRYDTVAESIEYVSREPAPASRTRNLFQYDRPLDLYEQLDSLLREKSMLIAVV